MLGYVSPGSSTSFCRTISVLEDAAKNVWPLGKVTFNKFGNKIVPLENRDYIKATTTSFYSYSEDFKDTLVDKVIEGAKSDDLTIIVTDLFEQESDINRIAAQIRDKYLVNGLSLGLIAVRSEFSGNIYDVGINAYNFKYSSGSDSSTYRPFYVLVLGKQKDVESYYEKLETAGLNNIKEKNYILFSKYIVSPKLTLKDSTVVNADKLITVTNLFEGDKNDKRVKEFKINKNTKNAAVTFKTPYNPVSNTMKLDTGKLDVITEVKVCKNGVLENAEDFKDNIKIKNSIDGSDMKTSFDFDTSNLPSKQVISFDVTVKPSSEAYSLPDWVNSWDMDISKLDEWKSKPEAFNGSGTINLKRFVNGLWQGTVQMHKPEIAHFMIYMIKD
jgi:hypothetical protein